jgi:hypothetical protein
MIYHDNGHVYVFCHILMPDVRYFGIQEPNMNILVFMHTWNYELCKIYLHCRIVFNLLLDLLIGECALGRVIRGSGYQPTQLIIVKATKKFHSRNSRCLHGESSTLYPSLTPISPLLCRPTHHLSLDTPP